MGSHLFKVQPFNPPKIFPFFTPSKLLAALRTWLQSQSLCWCRPPCGWARNLACRAFRMFQGKVLKEKTNAKTNISLTDIIWYCILFELRGITIECCVRMNFVRMHFEIIYCSVCFGLRAIWSYWHCKINMVCLFFQPASTLSFYIRWLAVKLPSRRQLLQSPELGVERTEWAARSIIPFKI